jgi:hypothetical protein
LCIEKIKLRENNSSYECQPLGSFMGFDQRIRLRY